MARPALTIIAPFSITLLGIMYYHHHRLLTTYPTLRVPPALEISARQDKPALGMSGRGDEDWMRTHAGEMWQATVPRRLLFRAKDSTSDDAVIAFARAFWSSWPLKMERKIVTALAKAGILFSIRDSDVGVEGERNFTNSAKVIGGLFVVEAHDASPPAVESSEVYHGPIVTSWWLRPLPASESPGPVGLLGGYHSFAVKDISPKDDEEPMARLCFVSHLILSSSPPADRESIPTSSLDLSLRHRLVIYFHVLYSRILLDLAVRGLKSA